MIIRNDNGKEEKHKIKNETKLKRVKLGQRNKKENWIFDRGYRLKKQRKGKNTNFM